MTPISVINEWRSAFCLLVCSLPSSVFSLVSPLLSIMTNSSESPPSSTIYEEQRTNSPAHQPRPVRTMKRSVCSMGTFLLSQRQSFSQCSSSLPPVSSPLSLTRRIRADPLSSNPPWAGNPVQDVVSSLHRRGRWKFRNHRMGCSNLLPLLPRQIDAVPHPDSDDYQRSNTLGCRLLHHPCGSHSSPWPMLQSFEAEDVYVSINFLICLVADSLLMYRCNRLPHR